VQQSSLKQYKPSPKNGPIMEQEKTNQAFKISYQPNVNLSWWCQTHNQGNCQEEMTRK